MAYPEMGNVGINADDEESGQPHAVGMVVRENSAPSNWRATETLDAYLRAAPDRRHRGARHPQARPPPAHPRRADGRDLERGGLAEGARREGEDRPRDGGARPRDGDLDRRPPTSGPRATPERARPASRRPRRSRASTWSPYDYGLKRSMLQFLVDVGCRVTVVPAGFTAEEVLAQKPRRRLPHERPRRPGGGEGRGQDRRRAARQGADLRHLPRPPDPRARARRRRPTR